MRWHCYSNFYFIFLSLFGFSCLYFVYIINLKDNFEKSCKFLRNIVNITLKNIKFQNLKKYNFSYENIVYNW